MVKSKVSKKNLAYEKIRTLICKPDFLQDETLTETSLAEKLGLSRTPVREALIELQSEGFLTIIPHRGIFIQEPSISEVRNLYDIRIALEQFVLRELCGSIVEDNFKFFEEIMSEQESCIPDTKTDDFIAKDRKFHEFFFELYGNPLMLDQFLKLRSRLYRVNYRMLQSRENMRTFHGEHRTIISMLRSGNGEGAVEVMGSHLKGAKGRLL